MSETFRYSLFILFGTFISAVSQVLLKKAAEKQYRSFWDQYLNPLVIGAYMIFVIATLCSVIAYRGIPLSLGPILETTSYVYITYFGVTIFHEKMNAKKAAALLLIIAGIIVYSLGG